jgi:MFS superfamily sulfate permease-like transporter
MPKNNKPKTLTAHTLPTLSDFRAGLMVSLLALPLSLGIARASGLPPAAGVLTAIIGGLFTGWQIPKSLAIKGPAAGLITITAAAVFAFSELGNAMEILSAAIIITALIQALIGWKKWAVFSDFFPHSAVNGMLAAIGVIIIAKQTPVLLGHPPEHYEGLTPFELLSAIPQYLMQTHPLIGIVGFISLSLLFALSRMRNPFFKIIPVPLIVLSLSIGLGYFLKLESRGPLHTMVSIGNFFEQIQFSPDFSAVQYPVFWKFVLLFLFVSSLESLLTVKAIDALTTGPNSNYNKEITSQATGNFISGILGGLPMISEVVRSSANVGFGAKSHWSNVFHGLSLLLMMWGLVGLIEHIPNAALAAMLIYAGFRLAAPRQFLQVYKLGAEQLAIFITTLWVTLASDLLLGILAGILTKILFHLFYGVPPKTLFSSNHSWEKRKNNTVLYIENSALFTNLILYKKIIENAEKNKLLTIDLSRSFLVDHSFMTFLRYIQYNTNGKPIQITGLENHRPLSSHPLASRRL